MRGSIRLIVGLMIVFGAVGIVEQDGINVFNLVLALAGLAVIASAIDTLNDLN